MLVCRYAHYGMQERSEDHLQGSILHHVVWLVLDIQLRLQTLAANAFTRRAIGGLNLDLEK